jgi:gamma-glutamylcyclotransferase (GGCT)/AIG2-like uncharacterized protein YtfP
MSHVFTYGSLMFDPVWSRVVAGSYDRCEAILPAYDRKGIRGEMYPAVVPSAHQSQVQGILYLDVSTPDLDRLDRFEGELYSRKKEQIITMDMAIVSAEVYVLREEHYALLSPAEWDPVHFNTKDIKFFMKTFMDIDEQ